MLNKDKNMCVGIYWNDVRDMDKSFQDNWMTHSAQQKEKWRPQKERGDHQCLYLFGISACPYTPPCMVLRQATTCAEIAGIPLWSGQPQRNHWVICNLEIFLDSTLVVSWSLSTCV
jgi:hypothetical protein